MRTVLALEPDPRQAAALKLVVSNRVGRALRPRRVERRRAVRHPVGGARPDPADGADLAARRERDRRLDSGARRRRAHADADHPAAGPRHRAAREEEEARVAERVDRRGRRAGRALGMRPGGVCRRGRQLPVAGRTRQGRSRARRASGARKSRSARSATSRKRRRRRPLSHPGRATTGRGTRRSRRPRRLWRRRPLPSSKPPSRVVHGRTGR